MFLEREERLRKSRARAQTLRSSFPSASLVEVRLQFLPATTPPHAEQSFKLYPGARAFFGYPCPYGDCDGIYELGPEADRALTGHSSCVTGTLECGGVRSRDGLSKQPCGLRVTYRIAAHHEVQKSA